MNKSELKVINLSNYEHLQVKGQRLAVVEVVRDYKTTDGGIVLASANTPEVFSHGVVVGVGEPYIMPNGQERSLGYNLGDFVYFGSSHVGADVKVQVGEGLETVKCVGTESIHLVDNTHEGEFYLLTSDIQK